jgi:hypothetical protein
MELYVEVIERFLIRPWERRIGRGLTRWERMLCGVIATSPLTLFVIVCIVRVLIFGPEHRQ